MDGSSAESTTAENTSWGAGGGDRYKIAGVNIWDTAAWEVLGQTGAAGAKSADKAHHGGDATGCKAAKHGAMLANLDSRPAAGTLPLQHGHKLLVAAKANSRSL